MIVFTGRGMRRRVDNFSRCSIIKYGKAKKDYEKYNQTKIGYSRLLSLACFPKSASSLFYCESVSVFPVSGAGSFLLMILDVIIE